MQADLLHSNMYQRSVTCFSPISVVRRPKPAVFLRKLNYDLGCLFEIPGDIEPPPIEVLKDFVNNFIVEEIAEPCIDAMCPRSTGRSILRNTVPTDIRIAFFSCGQVGYSLADMTPDIQFWLKAGFHGLIVLRRSA